MEIVDPSPTTVDKLNSLSNKPVLFGEVVFSLNKGQVSKPFENLNKTFSIVRLERFLEEELFSLDRVYSQIKQKLIKETKDSIRLNLSKDLFNKNKAQLNKEVLSF